MTTSKLLEENKCTYSERPYAEILRELDKRLNVDSIDPILVEAGIIPFPHDIPLESLASAKDEAIAFAPYCLKPSKCPSSDKKVGRKNKECMQLNSNCDMPCYIRPLLDVLQKHNFDSDRILIIDSDSNLIKWLEEKKREGYEYILPAVSCKFAVAYALDEIGGRLGYKGLIMLIDGNVCKSGDEYSGMEKLDKGKYTQIDINSVKLLDEILSGKFR